MTMTFLLWLLLSLGVSTTLGFCLVCLLMPGGLSPRQWVLFGSLAMGYGLALSSSLFFLWLVVCRSFNGGFIALELVVSGVLTFICATRMRHQCGKPGALVPSGEGWSRIGRFLSIPFFILLFSSLLTFLMLSYDHPTGGVDAWGEWNMRARFIFRGGEFWVRACSPLLANPDYPLLIPGLIARCWSYMGQDLFIVPIAIALLFEFGTVGLLLSSLALLRSPSQGFLAGSILLGTPFFLDYATSQYADVPIGFFFLATFVLLALRDRVPRERHTLLIFAGLGAGFSAWTKNEGILFIAVLAAVRSVSLLRNGGKKAWTGEFLPVMAGLLPVAALVVYFKIALAPPNYIFSPQIVSSMPDKLTDLTRYQFIASTFVTSFYKYFRFLPFALLMYFLLIGRTSQAGRGFSILPMVGTLLLMLAGYFLIYVISPVELTFHMGSSLHRLLLQLWPSSLFAYFLAVRSPEELLKRTSTNALPGDSQERHSVGNNSRPRHVTSHSAFEERETTRT